MGEKRERKRLDFGKAENVLSLLLDERGFCVYNESIFSEKEKRTDFRKAGK